jgi:pSer/pThr/pTyr-binding forkhead associated (FHA) protein
MAEKSRMDRSETTKPVLIGQSGILNGVCWPLEGTILIGRDPECNVVISDRQVSRFHARINLTPDGVVLEDLGSKNGSCLNGAQVNEPAFLQDGDLIQIALVQQFVFLSSDSTLPMDQRGRLNASGKGKLRLDPRSRRVWVGEEELIPPLSVPQFNLLNLLYNQAGDVVSRQDLMLAVWGEEEAISVSDQAMDALIRRLRYRIEEKDPDHTYIITVRGHGVRLDNPIR